MNRKDRPLINKLARKVTGDRLTTCTVGEGYHNKRDGSTSFNYDETYDLANNGLPLADFKLPSKDWNGTLDIWVYTYELASGPYADPCHELHSNIYATVVDGRVTKVEE